MSEHATPVGGRLVSRPFKFLSVLFLVSVVLIVWRLVAGIGAVTALSDGYPWGLWIAFDVVTGTALACGGYAVALIVYILNKGKYHAMVRPAILTSALGYTMAAIGITLDVGRPWVIWKVPLFFWHWNLNSALLEVALCVMSYVGVLWVELSPAFLEKWRSGPEGTLKTISSKVLPILDKALVWIIALGMLLPTMHQSSLGTLMMLTGPKLHPLWNTPLLPLLFLTSCLAMGYAVVVFESTLSSTFFGRERETEMLAGLSKVMVPFLIAFTAVRLLDVAFRGRLGLAFAFDLYGVMFLLETALFLSPVFLLASARARLDPGNLFRAALLMMLAGSLYRFDTYLVAFRPGANWSYFPSIPEMLITIGLVAAEVMVYVAVVRYFPILAGARGPAIPAAQPSHA